MDKHDIHTRSAQDLDVAPEDIDTVPPYSPNVNPVGAGWMTITLDRTGMVIKKLPPKRLHASLLSQQDFARR